MERTENSFRDTGWGAGPLRRLQGGHAAGVSEPPRRPDDAADEVDLLGGAFVASAPDPSAAREYARIKRGVLAGDTTVLAEYGGAQAALKRAIELQQAAQDRSRMTTKLGSPLCCISTAIRSLP